MLGIFIFNRLSSTH
jgi:hypothetical protein